MDKISPTMHVNASGIGVILERRKDVMKGLRA